MLLLLLFVHTVDGNWETHHDHLAYMGYEVDYPDDDYDELELQEVVCSIFCTSFAYFWTGEGSKSLQRLFFLLPLFKNA